MNQDPYTQNAPESDPRKARAQAEVEDSLRRPIPDAVGVEPKSGLVGALGTYLTARIELLGIEAKEAGQACGERAAFAIAALMLAAIGYLLTLVTLVGLLAAAIQPALGDGYFGRVGGWPLASLCFALFHIGIAALFINRVRNKPLPDLFYHSRNELLKDKAFSKSLNDDPESQTLPR